MFHEVGEAEVEDGSSPESLPYFWGPLYTWVLHTPCLEAPSHAGPAEPRDSPEDSSSRVLAPEFHPKTPQESSTAQVTSAGFDGGQKKTDPPSSWVPGAAQCMCGGEGKWSE